MTTHFKYSHVIVPADHDLARMWHEGMGFPLDIPVPVIWETEMTGQVWNPDHTDSWCVTTSCADGMTIINTPVNIRYYI